MLFAPNIPSRREGFTLIEVLVAMSVLVLIVVLTAQLTNNAANTTLVSSKRLEVDNDVRTTFDRMASDLASMPKRPDLDYVFAKLPQAQGSDAFYFYSQAPGFTRSPDAYNTPMAFVGFSVRRTSSSDSGSRPMYKLERSGFRLARGDLRFRDYPFHKPKLTRFAVMRMSEIGRVEQRFAKFTLAGVDSDKPLVAGSNPAAPATS